MSFFQNLVYVPHLHHARPRSRGNLGPRDTSQRSLSLTPRRPLPPVRGRPDSGRKTFKPHKNIPEGTKQYQLKKYAEATLGSGNLRLAVALPEGEDINEWLAVNSTRAQRRGSGAREQERADRVMAKFCRGRAPLSGRLFQPNQHALRDYHRVLHAARVQGHVRGAQVRVPLVGRRAV